MQQKDPKTDERVEGETKRSRTAQIDQNNKTKRQEIKVKAEIRQSQRCHSRQEVDRQEVSQGLIGPTCGARFMETNATMASFRWSVSTSVRGSQGGFRRSTAHVKWT